MSNITQSNTVSSPLIIPSSSQHTHTFILLHGRGSNASRFAFDSSIPTKPGILRSVTSSGLTLPQLFPGMKFIFPTAPKRRSTARKRAKMNIWFDNSSFSDPYAHEELQVDGLCENGAYLRQLILREAQTLLSLQKVFMCGISQGCAMALHVLLSLDTVGSDLSGGLGGFVGISGWLPFQVSLDALVSPAAHDNSEASDNVDPFGSMPYDSDQANPSEMKAGVRVAQFIREDIMDLSKCPEEAMCFYQTAIILGHGDRDDNVKLEYGERSMLLMNSLCKAVKWKVYESQGHWYKVPEQIDDIVLFLKENGC
ncbi:hypothetical protein MMC17_000593 [Xylographa soralifera]|nr:hypothetical protein [Xylographa soralifera]